MNRLGLYLTTAFLYAISFTWANSEGGPGLWIVHSITNCEEELARTAMNTTVAKHKLNRTHDVYDATITVFENIGDGYGVYIDVCKFTDGGCKLWQAIMDNDIGTFAEKYVQSNMEVAFTMAGIDPPRFPIEIGNYSIEDFYFNQCEMPEEAVYGEFTADAFIINENERVACVRVFLEFQEDEDNVCNKE